MKIDERNRMIDRLVSDMDSWDYEALLQYAQDLELQVLDNLSDEQIKSEYDARFGDKPEHPVSCRNCEQGGHPDFCGENDEPQS